MPYDCGVVAVRDPAALGAAMNMHGDYLIQDVGRPVRTSAGDVAAGARGAGLGCAAGDGPQRGRDLVERLCGHARTFADALAEIPGAEVVNDVVFTQVCASFGSDERTHAVVERMLADGTAWTTGSRWRDRAVLRISVSNASTTDEDVARSIERAAPSGG